MRAVFASLASLALVLSLPQLRGAEEPAKPNPLVGIWLGTLKAGPIPLRLAFTVTEADSKLAATLDSLDQGAKGIPFESVTCAAGKVRVASKALGVVYSGTLSDDGKSLTGQWKQGNSDLPLSMARVDKVPADARPQTPKPPYPYAAEDVSFENAAQKVTLAGTLTLPKGDGPFPAVVLVSGSGPQDRDETLFGHKPFLVLADHLTRQGIAVLRYDDRGVGQSTGDHAKATTADFATDAAAAVAYLHGRKEIDAKRVGIAGHSEGGLIAPIVAADHPDRVAFIVLLSGTGLPGHAVIDRQRADILKTSGAKPETIALYKTMYAKLLPILGGPGTIDERKDKIIAIVKATGDATTDELKAATGLAGPGVAKSIADALTSPWMAAFLAFDPVTALKRVKCPVLALNGTLDLQVAADENLPAIEAALKAGHNPPAKFVALPGLNHLFQPAKTGGIDEYPQIETTFDVAAMKLIAEWVLQVRPR